MHHNQTMAPCHYESKDSSNNGKTWFIIKLRGALQNSARLFDSVYVDSLIKTI